MNKLLLLFSFLLAFTSSLQAQQSDQYFEGTTTGPNKIKIHLDTAAANIWQIGRPQKTIFDSAATLPNALVTDTVNTYPMGNTSRFIIGFNTSQWYPWLYKVAFRWKQKLDLDTNHDGGIVEFSLDTGATWRNAFNTSTVYNFYGFNASNKDTLDGGIYAFSGTDSTWRDIWFCFDGDTLHKTDSFLIRFTLKSDSVENNREGWMIDNMMAQPTYFHTVSTVNPAQTFMVYPTITGGIIKIENDMGIEELESITVVDAQGKVIQAHSNRPGKTGIDISGHPAGNYFIRIGSADKAEIHRVILQY